MDNPPSTTDPTPMRRRVLFSGGAALAVAGCVGIAAAGAASPSDDPAVLSADYVRDEMALIHTQTAAKAVLFKAGTDVALSSVRKVGATVPTTVPAAAIAALAAPAAVPVVAPRPT
ncbi:MAG: hypothetical protein M3Z03_10335, partial [Actinomycetota bacterium]|nr:hypothetical protein [Actinomycetota bacterium]